MVLLNQTTVTGSYFYSRQQLLHNSLVTIFESKFHDEVIFSAILWVAESAIIFRSIFVISLYKDIYENPRDTAIFRGWRHSGLLFRQIEKTNFLKKVL